MEESDLRNRLNSTDIDTRRAAAASLVQMGVDGLRLLVEALPKNYQAEDALMRGKDPATLSLIMPHLASSDGHLRNIAVAITCEILAAHDSSVAPAGLANLLMPLIDDDSLYIQLAAVEALGLLRHEPARSALSALSTHPSLELKAAAAKAVRGIQPPSETTSSTTPLPAPATRKGGWLTGVLSWAGLRERKRPSRPDPFSEEDAVARILRVYDAYPEGFVRGDLSAPAKRLEEVGRRLNDRGGFELMQRVHAEFARRCRTPGAARNLEHMWDGIGRWQG